MPIVEIKGVGKAKFPDDMPIADIRSFLRKKYFNDAMSNNYSVPQRSNTAEPYSPSLTEKIGDKIGSALHDTGIISNRYGAQQIGKNLTAIGEFLPGIGDATAGDEFGKSLSSGDKLGMGLAALGIIPVIGDSARKGAKKLAKALKSNNIDSLDKLLKSDYVGYNVGTRDTIPQRSFENDYQWGSGLQNEPQGIGQHGDLLTKTIEGVPITARHVAGRNVVQGGDEAVRGARLEEIATERGATIEPATRTELRRAAGEIKNPASSSPSIKYDKSLAGEKRDIVIAHEVSHMIDEVAGQLPTAGIKKDLEQIYHIQNTPSYRPNMPRKQWALPKYDTDRELMAESIRMYLTNPNYIKSKFPQVAKTIRKFVNENPNLNKSIQFNSVLAATIGAKELQGGDSGAE